MHSRKVKKLSQLLQSLCNFSPHGNVTSRPSSSRGMGNTKIKFMPCRCCQGVLSSTYTRVQGEAKSIHLSLAIKVTVQSIQPSTSQGSDNVGRSDTTDMLFKLAGKEHRSVLSSRRARTLSVSPPIAVRTRSSHQLPWHAKIPQNSLIT